METISNILGLLGGLELPRIGITDIVQIIIIAVVLYYFLVWVRNTRTWFLIRGIIFLAAFYGVAVVLELNTILFIVRNALSVLVMALIVVFQPELRRALEQLGQRNVFVGLLTGGQVHTDEEMTPKTVEELVKASIALGKARTGALIVIEREVPLVEYIQTGIELDAKTTAQLLINIFEHNTPLHDGAVIMQGSKLIAATCYLPLSKNPGIPTHLGTRHRAAIGVSEVTDSLTIVVSEETGKISLAEGGEISGGLTEDELRSRLSDLVPVPDKPLSFRFWKGWQRNEKTTDE